MADLIAVLSDQIGLPVDDRTGLTGRYDIALSWSDGSAAHSGNHAEGGSYGGAGHGGHDGAFSGAAPDASGPTLFDALQSQLGLKLVPAPQATVRLFVVDRILEHPTEN